MPGEEPRRGAQVNNVNLIGSLVGDPELSFDRDGRDVCAMQLAVQRRGPAGEPEPGVIYIDVTAYGHQARACGKQLSAGEGIGVGGGAGRGDSLGKRGAGRPRRGGDAGPNDVLASGP